MNRCKKESVSKRGAVAQEEYYKHYPSSIHRLMRQRWNSGLTPGDAKTKTTTVGLTLLKVCIQNARHKGAYTCATQRLRRTKQTCLP